MNPIGLLLSVVIGVSLGFFGGGGSILTVPLLVYVFGREPKEAIASSLLIVAIASCAAALQHWRAGNVQVRAGLVFGGAGMTGAYLGGRAGGLMDGGVLLLLFASIMVLTALAMWRGRRAPAKVEGAGVSTWKLVLQGFTVGCFTGLVGAGGGFLIVPALVLWAGLSMRAAVGTSLFVIVMNSLAGFLGYIAHVPVDYNLIVAVAAAAIAGSFLGARLTRHVEPGSLRRVFAGFVLAMALVILVREASLVVQAGASALPRTLPQVFFALLMLGVGVAAGRSSRGAVDPGEYDVSYQEGDGI
jgi:uncharacterized membrane protein YfcA